MAAKSWAVSAAPLSVPRYRLATLRIAMCRPHPATARPPFFRVTLGIHLPPERASRPYYRYTGTRLRWAAAHAQRDRLHFVSFLACVLGTEPRRKLRTNTILRSDDSQASSPSMPRVSRLGFVLVGTEKPCGGNSISLSQHQFSFSSLWLATWTAADRIRQSDGTNFERFESLTSKSDGGI